MINTADAPPGQAPVPTPSRAPVAPSPMARGTLGRQLVLRVVLLVAAAAILLSSATTLGTWELLSRQMNDQLDQVTSRLRSGPGGPRGGLLEAGQPIGTLAAAFNEDGEVLVSGQLQERGLVPTLSDGALAELAVIKPGAPKTTLSIAGLGRFRLAAYDAVIISGTYRVTGRVVVGLPLAQVDNTLIQLIGIEVALSVLATAGAAAAARTLVLRSLRPLNRVASTAQLVSRLELDRGEVALAVRVPPSDTDPRNEVGRVGQAFNHMLNNVEAAFAARQASETKLRQFVADASHELRNPLASIRGYAELTRRDRDALPQGTNFALNRIESESVRMSSLVEDLFLLARLDSGPDLTMSPVDLTEVVINAVSDARAAGGGHLWLLDLPDEPVVADGDRNRLHQVVANLLANARTHTPAGTTVRTRVNLDRDQVVVSVIDDGPGIAHEVANRVFERFTRADASRTRTGEGGRSTGLGLAIVAAVVDAHHGTVQVASRPGETRFEIRLPRSGRHPRGSIETR